MSLKKYSGSCHCKSVCYEVEADLEKGTYKCNCTYCFKVRNWGCIVKPTAFRWLSGRDVVSDYQIIEGSKNHYYFCRKCGVRICTVGYIEEIGGDYLSFAISTLDNISDELRASLPVQPMDGFNNNWFAAPAIYKHL